MLFCNAVQFVGLVGVYVAVLYTERWCENALDNAWVKKEYKMFFDVDISELPQKKAFD